MAFDGLGYVSDWSNGEIMCLTLAARPVASSKGTSFPCNDPQDSDEKNAAHSSDNCMDGASGLLTVSLKRAASGLLDKFV